MNLLKYCKFCNTEIVQRPNKTEKLSLECFKRRKFCADKCKNAYGREKKEGKVPGNCLICNKVIFSFPSKKRQYCSKECTDKSKIKPDIVRYCIVCKSSYIARSPNKKTYFCSRKCHQSTRRVTKKCPTCNKEFTNPKSKEMERCSRKCAYKDQSSGIIKSHINGRTGYRLDIPGKNYFKSSLEADFARFLNFIKIEYMYEYKTFATPNGFYTPDFFIPSLQLYVELKGVNLSKSKFSKMMNKNINKGKQIKGINYCVITQDMFISAMKRDKLWDKIPNIEQKNYKKTKILIYK